MIFFISSMFLFHSKTDCMRLDTYPPSSQSPLINRCSCPRQLNLDGCWIRLVPHQQLRTLGNRPTEQPGSSRCHQASSLNPVHQQGLPEQRCRSALSTWGSQVVLFLDTASNSGHPPCCTAPWAPAPSSTPGADPESLSTLP